MLSKAKFQPFSFEADKEKVFFLVEEKLLKTKCFCSCEELKCISLL